MTKPIKQLFILALCCSLLAGCGSMATRDSGNRGEQGELGRGGVAGGNGAGPNFRVLSEAELQGRGADSQRSLPDILYDGLQALADDRLLTPPDRSAYIYFRLALIKEPNNAIALQGLNDIVLRYVELAGRAMRRGLFEQAATLLSRAATVDESHPALSAAHQALAAERQTNDLVFELNTRDLQRRNAAAVIELHKIARQARDLQAFFLIVAPTDELARWMFKTMREAVTGYRLRGNIELADRSIIRLRVSEPEQ